MNNTIPVEYVGKTSKSKLGIHFIIRTIHFISNFVIARGIISPWMAMGTCTGPLGGKGDIG